MIPYKYSVREIVATILNSAGVRYQKAMQSLARKLSKGIGRPLARFTNSFFFQYETPRLLTMRTRHIGIMYRFIQLLLLVYVIAYVFIVMKSYQTFDYVNSSVVTKVKGVLSYNNSGVRYIWDSTDFVVPAQESGAFFIATNVLMTRNQSHGICPEDINVGSAGIECTNDGQCPANQPTLYGNGIRTGRCVKQSGTCEIAGWCPTEIDSTPRTATLTGHESITILVKNHIVFPNFGVKRRNILKHFSQEYLQSCRFHPEKDPICPIFNLLDIVRFANESMETLAIRVSFRR
ncbi:hypothetical protein RvY_06346-1 [Ramazzottius varieornatus]|uniref:Purinergic receptor n=1 Tax=Ramazzottius varieornatus TaxID=947166 RepID=A0A1D1V4M3_RAMVA|nr:hypothetical protein RvY_06346-1 [Ramazzottius varieornatus]